MSIEYGLSSGTLPEAPVDDLVRVCRRHGGTTLDLRADKGQRWDADGASDALAAVAAARMSVAFIGLGWLLGDATAPIASVEEWALLGYPLKVFCAPAPDADLVARQVSELSASGCPLLIETHRGGPSLERLATIVEHSGAGTVADSLGVLECSGPDADLALARLAPSVTAIQLKGVVGEGRARRHRPLAEADLELVELLLGWGAPIGSITLESRAGAVDDDLDLIARFVAENAVVKGGA